MDRILIGISGQVLTAENEVMIPNQAALKYLYFLAVLERLSQKGLFA